MRTRSVPKTFLASLLGAAALVVSSSCGGGGGGGGLPEFRVNGVSVTNNAILKLNRSIEISFTEQVDFSTVSLNTIRIASSGGTPVAGTFTLLNPTTVSFQPACPTLPDFSDGGFLPGGVQYELAIIAASPGNPLAVRSRGGAPIVISETRKFFTPNSSDPTELFFDALSGAPAPVVRNVGSSNMNASYVEVGGDPTNRFYFERDPQTGSISVNPPLSMPLNLYSAEDTQVAFVLAIDQPISPLGPNVSSEATRLEFRDAGGTWRRLETDVTLVSNCTGTGALLRLEPVGVLPGDAMVRAVVTTLLEDLVGETNLVPLDSFALAATVPPPAPLADDFVETFNSTTNENLTVPFAEPRAEWGAGTLGAAFSFPGTGGSSGNFDWRVPVADVEFLDTTFDTIRGGPGFIPQSDLPVIGGVIDVRNLEVPAGAELRAMGPNPLTIYASGTVRIEGLINASGVGNLGANTVGTANIPEAGSPGQAGGGKGGDSSSNTTISTPVGSTGRGPFQANNGGGGGGETGWGSGAPDNRRGAGGGGGRFGPNQLNTSGGTNVFDQTRIGLDAEMGYSAHAPGAGGPENGAFDGTQTGHYDAPGAQGGQVGPTPFTDNSTTNDFFGRRFDPTTMTVTQGELLKLSAGAGGGGGGDAVTCAGATCVFPPPFNPATNQKGGAAGGGGGAVRIVALGNVIFSGAGQIRARGGFGGHGESIGNFLWLGGGGGGGSGGHVIIQTAGVIDFSGLNSNHLAVNATGGQGGAGRNNTGGANQFGEDNLPSQDACPEAMPQNCFGFVRGAGGDGGPGVVQLHTEGGMADILLPGGTMLTQLTAPRPQGPLIPQVGKRSRAQSEWIPLGKGGFRSSMPGFTPPTFDFGGTDPVTGLVLTANQMVAPITPPVLGPNVVSAAPTLPYIDPADGRTLVLDSSALAQAQVLNPSLLERFVLQLFETGNAANRADFEVAAASVDTMAGEVRLTVSSSGPALTSFLPPGTVSAQVFQTFFAVETDGMLNALPDTASVQIQFEATTADLLGEPVPPATPMFTPDITTLNTGTDFRFLRFQVLFDIDTMGQGLSLNSPQPALRYLRLPFSY